MPTQLFIYKDSTYIHFSTIQCCEPIIPRARKTNPPSAPGWARHPDPRPRREGGGGGRIGPYICQLRQSVPSSFLTAHLSHTPACKSQDKTREDGREHPKHFPTAVDQNVLASLRWPPTTLAGRKRVCGLDKYQPIAKRPKRYRRRLAVSDRSAALMPGSPAAPW